MKKLLIKACAFCIAAIGTLSVTTLCWAEDPFTKLGRGVANTLTGWVEIPKNIYSTSVEDNAFSGLTLGLAKGIGMTFVRTGTGIYEVVTFPAPLPEDYKPVLEPEYVF